MKKIFPSRVRISVLFLIAMLIVGALIFWVFNQFFLTSWGVGQIIATSCYVAVVVSLYIVTIKTTYYVFDKKYFIFKRWGKSLYYTYNDIVYIDQSKGEKTKTLGFFTNKGHTIYLTCDNKGELYNIVLDSCKNLLTYEALKKKYPKANI